jgi:mono/diheme cytochrome c family protein
MAYSFTWSPTMISHRRRISPALPFLVSLVAGPAVAADSPEPQALYEQHCLKCHGSEVYTRPDRKIDSYPALARQVRQCETNLELRWFDEEVEAVTDYLNRNYYKFAP